ncbi:MAG TPA: response regulator [Hyphomicrobiales bacterium]|nr:response regulator [Hyphomicrobiales bacterium]
MNRRPLLLLVCSSPLLGECLCRELAPLDCECRLVPEAADAASLTTDAALILVELLLAGEVGFQALRRLRSNYAGPLVLLSGSGRPSDEPWALAAGASQVLSYPLRHEALRALLPS